MEMPDDHESPLGAFIRSQRELQAMSVRQLAELSGISNPYLSQIERGLREPSEQVLGAIAEQLELSADALKQHGARSTETTTTPSPRSSPRSARTPR